ncbi:MAG: serine hydrolase [Candidatus Magasanikbacteria bacterium]|nr:serine hydrolase [Candidatus Magasanikbacteria bacterium]
MKTIFKNIAIFGLVIGVITLTLVPLASLAQADFNPHLIISDQEMQNATNWTTRDIQDFLERRGSFLASYSCPDFNGAVKTAAEIIYDAANTYQVNPKYILVTLQKEQSLITDDSPTQKQLDWAAGYGICDACSMDESRLQKYRGFGRQVNNAAGIIRWYYDNQTHPVVKKKDAPIVIDNRAVTPQSWATAFLYTYTPHIHGNQNFWRIWSTWFEMFYPNGTLLKSLDDNTYWLVQDGVKRKFANMGALVSRLNPKIAIEVASSDLSAYATGVDLLFPNYSLLQTSTSTYLLDYDTLRPFASEAVVRALGYNPQEIVEISDTDIAGYMIGSPITVSTTAPEGLVLNVTDIKKYYFIKDNILYPITNEVLLEVKLKSVPMEKRRASEIADLEIAALPLPFPDGTMLQVKGSNVVYVIEKGKRRRIADDETFRALGYKRSNIIFTDNLTLATLPSGEGIFINSALLSSKNKYLGDAGGPILNSISTTAGSYLLAEYPSGRILAGKNVDIRYPLASITKILTGYEALEQDFVPDKKMITYNTKLDSAENNILKLTARDSMSRGDLWNAMYVGSVNAAAKIIARLSAGTEQDFVARINDRLASWGADNTSIVEPTGLSADNQTTARDLLKIFIKTAKNDTVRKAMSQVNYRVTIKQTGGKVRIQNLLNTNQLLRLKNKYYTVKSSKTGYTDEGGATLVMLIESKKTKKQYVVITLNNLAKTNRFAAADKIAKLAAQDKVTIANFK